MSDQADEKLRDLLSKDPARSDRPRSLSTFLADVAALALSRSPCPINVSNQRSLPLDLVKGMSVKKQTEVARFAWLVDQVAEQVGVENVIVRVSFLLEQTYTHV